MNKIVTLRRCHKDHLLTFRVIWSKSVSINQGQPQGHGEHYLVGVCKDSKDTQLFLMKSSCVLVFFFDKENQILMSYFHA